jgi:hypothetical protein
MTEQPVCFVGYSASDFVGSAWRVPGFSRTPTVGDSISIIFGIASGIPPCNVLAYVHGICISAATPLPHSCYRQGKILHGLHG